MLSFQAMIDIEKVIEDKVQSVLNVVQTSNRMLSKFDPEVKKATVEISFYPIYMDEYGIAKIPVGVPGKPAGISVSDADYVLFISNMYDEHKYIHIADLKSILKSRWSDIEKKLDEEYKVMCVELNVNDL